MSQPSASGRRPPFVPPAVLEATQRSTAHQPDVPPVQQVQPQAEREIYLWRAPGERSPPRPRLAAQARPAVAQTTSLPRQLPSQGDGPSRQRSPRPQSHPSPHSTMNDLSCDPASGSSAAAATTPTSAGLATSATPRKPAKSQDTCSQCDPVRRKLNSLNQRLEEEVGRSTRQSRSHRDEVRQLESRITQLEEALTRAEESQAALSQRNSEQENQLQMKTQELAELQKTIVLQEELISSKQEVESKLVLLRQQAAMQETQLKERQEECERLQENLSLRQTQFEEVSAQLEASTSHVYRLTAEKNDLVLQAENHQQFADKKDSQASDSPEVCEKSGSKQPKENKDDMAESSKDRVHSTWTAALQQAVLQQLTNCQAILQGNLAPSPSQMQQLAAVISSMHSAKPADESLAEQMDMSLTLDHQPKQSLSRTAEPAQSIVAEQSQTAGHMRRSDGFDECSTWMAHTPQRHFPSMDFNAPSHADYSSMTVGPPHTLPRRQYPQATSFHGYSPTSEAGVLQPSARLSSHNWTADSTDGDNLYTAQPSQWQPQGTSYPRQYHHSHSDSAASGPRYSQQPVAAQRSMSSHNSATWQHPDVASRFSFAATTQQRLPKIGDEVEVALSVQQAHSTGTVQYVGPLQNNPHTFVGVELDTNIGGNQESVEGHSYFKCTPGHGVIVPLERITMVTSLYD